MYVSIMKLCLCEANVKVKSLREKRKLAEDIRNTRAIIFFE